MGRLWIVAITCNYKGTDRQLKEQFMHGLNDNVMMAEIIKELRETEENKDVTSNEVLQWARWVEAHRTQMAVHNNLKIDQEYHVIQSEKQKRKKHKIQNNQTRICKYCGHSHPLWRCPVSRKRCGECGKMNHLRAVFRSTRHGAVHKVEN